MQTLTHTHSLTTESCSFWLLSNLFRVSPSGGARSQRLTANKTWLPLEAVSKSFVWTWRLSRRSVTPDGVSFFLSDWGLRCFQPSPGCSLLPVRLCLSGGVRVAPGDGQSESFEVARCGSGGPAWWRSCRGGKRFSGGGRCREKAEGEQRGGKWWRQVGLTMAQRAVLLPILRPEWRAEGGCVWLCGSVWKTQRGRRTGH